MKTNRSVRIPKVIYAKIDRISKKTGISKISLIVQAIWDYFSNTPL